MKNSSQSQRYLHLNVLSSQKQDLKKSSGKSSVRDKGENQLKLRIKQQLDLKNGVVILDNLKIRDESIEKIKRCLLSANLSLLSLKGNQISDTGIECLVRTKNRLNVKVLDLSNNKLTPQSLPLLLELVEASRSISKIVFQDIPIKHQLKKSYIQSFKRLNVELVL